MLEAQYYELEAKRLVNLLKIRSSDLPCPQLPEAAMDDCTDSEHLPGDNDAGQHSHDSPAPLQKA